MCSSIRHVLSTLTHSGPQPPLPSTRPTASSPGCLKTQPWVSHAHFSFSSENCFSKSSISLTHSLRRRS